MLSRMNGNVGALGVSAPVSLLSSSSSSSTSSASLFSSSTSSSGRLVRFPDGSYAICDRPAVLILVFFSPLVRPSVRHSEKRERRKGKKKSEELGE